LGLSWPDWVLLLLLVIFALGGLLRGAIAQVFSVLGVLMGLWAAVFISGWVGAHWSGARPALVFVALRWLVAGLGALAVAAIFQWWGDRLGNVVDEGPLGWLDRGAGLLVGAAVGVFVCAFFLVGALTLRIPGGPGVAVANARTTAPALALAAEVSSRGHRYLPGASWMTRSFLAARQRAAMLRRGDTPAQSG
jgi:hypothetical protein